MWSWLKERMCYVTYNSIIKKALPYVEAFKRVLVENAYVHLTIPSCSLIGFSAIGKVLRSPSAKNVPPARFLNADIRVQHSPFGLLIEITDSPLDYPLFHGGECWTRTSDLLRVKQAL